MNLGNETLGVRVGLVTPQNGEENINVYSKITVEFSSNINPQSLVGSVLVFQDTEQKYTNAESLKEFRSFFDVVDVSVSYKDRILTIEPVNEAGEHTAFLTNMKYILILNNTIKDINDNVMSRRFLSSFTTSQVATKPKLEFRRPKYGVIANDVPEFIWDDLGSGSYEFQLSKNNSFELLLCQEMIEGGSGVIQITPTVQLEDGIYYARAKAEDGEWSDPLCFYVKALGDGLVANEDLPKRDLDEFLEGLQDPLEVLSYYPGENEINVPVKNNLLYVKFKGRITYENLGISKCYVYGERINEEEEDVISHEEVEGAWSLIYDHNEDVTYLLFVPAALEDAEQEEGDLT